MGIHEAFIYALQQKKRIRIQFFSLEEGIPLHLLCIPLDFGPREHSYYGESIYQCLLPSDNQQYRIIAIRPKQVQSIELSDQDFDPADFIDWDVKDRPWCTQREWEHYS